MRPDVELHVTGNKESNSIITKRISLYLVCIYLNTFFGEGKNKNTRKLKVNKESQKEFTVDTTCLEISFINI